MTPRSKLWRVAGAVYVLINVAGAGYAAVVGEPVHAAAHVALLLGGYVVWRLAPRAQRQDEPRVQQTDEQLEYIQQSVDAIAVEVERIGEAQRFNDKLRAELGENSER